MGLFYVASRVKQWKGAFQLRSGKGMLCRAYLPKSGWTSIPPCPGEIKTQEFFPGTQLKILLPIDVNKTDLHRLSSDFE